MAKLIGKYPKINQCKQKSAKFLVKRKSCIARPLNGEYLTTTWPVCIHSSSLYLRNFCTIGTKPLWNPKIHIFSEGHKILQNLHRRFVWCSKVWTFWETHKIWNKIWLQMEFAPFCISSFPEKITETLHANIHAFIQLSGLWPGNVCL